MLPKQGCETAVVAGERKEGLVEETGLLPSAEAIQRIAKKSNALTTHILSSLSSFATNSAGGYCGQGVTDETSVTDGNINVPTERMEADVDEMRDDDDNDIVSTPREENGLEEMASCYAGVARNELHEFGTTEFRIAEVMKDIEEAILETLGMSAGAAPNAKDDASVWTEATMVTSNKAGDAAAASDKKDRTTMPADMEIRGARKIKSSFDQQQQLEAYQLEYIPDYAGKREKEQKKVKESSAQIKKLEALLNDVPSSFKKERLEEERENVIESSTQIKKLEALLNSAPSPSNKEKMEEEQNKLTESIAEMKKQKVLSNVAKLKEASAKVKKLGALLNDE